MLTVRLALATEGAAVDRPLPEILTYCPLPYNGKGPAKSCVALLEKFPPHLVTPELFVPRARAPVASSVHLHETLAWPFRRFPWKIVSGFGHQSLMEAFRRRIDLADPKNAIAYFWPEPPVELVVRAKQRGLMTVREMINCYRGTAKRILDDAYRQLGLPPSHGISEASVEREKEELSKYDFVFASKQVEPTLAEAGVDPARILPTSFGWSPDRFAAPREGPSSKTIAALFVGTVSVRKGIPQLLAAWKRSGVPGKLLVVGEVERAVKPILESYASDKSIEFIGYANDVGALYRSADFFVFPTFEEGGPQVVYEAAGCGLPVVTTPMGSGRLIENGVNGLVVEAGDVGALAEAMSKMAASPMLRGTLGAKGAADAVRFTYEKIGAERVFMLTDALLRRG